MKGVATNYLYNKRPTETLKPTVPIFVSIERRRFFFSGPYGTILLQQRVEQMPGLEKLTLCLKYVPVPIIHYLHNKRDNSNSGMVGNALIFCTNLRVISFLGKKITVPTTVPAYYTCDNGWPWHWTRSLPRLHTAQGSR